MLEGRHALVTGGGTGIGRAIAQSLAAQGASVTVFGRTIEQQSALTEKYISAAAVDVRDEAQLETALADAVAARGPVQICVANAGILRPASFHKTTLSNWRDTMATNLDGVFLTIRAAMKSMQHTDWGRVITLATVSGRQGLKNGVAYSASKHGVIGLTRALSEEFLETPFTFNALCPGPVDTAMAEQKLRTGGKPMLQALEDMAGENRHNRLLAPEEVAATALWLCSPGAASINGQTIDITGGQA